MFYIKVNEKETKKILNIIRNENDSSFSHLVTIYKSCPPLMQINTNNFLYTRHSSEYSYYFK